MPTVSESLSELVSASHKLMAATREILRQQDDAQRQARIHLPYGHDMFGGKSPVSYLTPSSNRKILVEALEARLKAAAFYGRPAYAILWDRHDRSTTLLTLQPGQAVRVETWQQGVLSDAPRLFKTAAQAIFALC